MSKRRFPVTLEPAGVTVWAEEGSTVLDVARHAGVMIPAPCGGRGVCGKCAVKVTSGAAAPPDDKELVGLSLAPKGVRLACRMKVNGPVSIKPMVAVKTTSVTDEPLGDEPLVAGIDLGTTTVSAVVVGERSGRQLGRGTVPNRQGSYGADVLSRVAAGVSGSAAELQEAAQQSALDALCAACGSACSCLSNVTRIVVVGNSVMATALLGESLEGFAAHPFTAPDSGIGQMTDGWYGDRDVAADLETIVLPPVASFIGGDTTSALLAAGLIDASETSIMVDMGTNAEIAIASKGGLLVTSAAAGPALEGMGIQSGGPYGEGAVTRVTVEGSTVNLDVAGGGEPAWLAGSGLISAIASLRRCGHLDAGGLMTPDGPLADRFIHLDDVLGVTLHEDDDARIVLTQLDVRAFQQAKAGVAAAVYMAAKTERIKPRRVARLVVTGALGASSGAEDLIFLGVLPADLADVTEMVEAAALTGAGMLATDPALLDIVQPYSRSARHLDLAGQASFTDTFMGALSLGEYTIQRGF